MKIIKNYWEVFTLIGIQLILAALRYFNIIHWKWIYVLMPLWILLTIFLLILILAYIESKQ